MRELLYALRDTAEAAFALLAIGAFICMVLLWADILGIGL